MVVAQALVLRTPWPTTRRFGTWRHRASRYREGRDRCTLGVLGLDLDRVTPPHAGDVDTTGGSAVVGLDRYGSAVGADQTNRVIGMLVSSVYPHVADLLDIELITVSSGEQVSVSADPIANVEHEISEWHAVMMHLNRARL